MNINILRVNNIYATIKVSFKTHGLLILGNCPESSMKKWQVKNAIGMWKKDPSISMTCAEERAVTPRPSFTTTTPARRPSYTTTRPTQRPSYGTTRRPTYGTTTPTPRPSHMVHITACFIANPFFHCPALF